MSKLDFSVFKAHLFLLLVNEFTKKENLRNENFKVHNRNNFCKAASPLTGKYLVSKLILKIKAIQFGNGNVLYDVITVTTATPNLISH